MISISTTFLVLEEPLQCKDPMPALSSRAAAFGISPNAHRTTRVTYALLFRTSGLQFSRYCSYTPYGNAT